MAVDLQALIPSAPGDGALFILGENYLGDPLSPGGGDLVWTTIQPPANGYTFNRSRSDVGLLSLTVPDGDPETDACQPGTPLRVVEPLPARLHFEPLTEDRVVLASVPGAARRFFYAYTDEENQSVTSNVDDAGTFTLTSSGASITVLVRLPNATERDDIFNQDASGLQGCQIAGRSAKAFTVAVTAPAGYTTTPVPAGPGATGGGIANGLATDDSAIMRITFTAPSAPFTLEVLEEDSWAFINLAAGFARLWSGTVQDCLDTDAKKGPSLLTVLGSDGVLKLAGTTVLGSPNTAPESFIERAQRLAALSPVPFKIESDYLPPPVAIPAGAWGAYGNAPAAIWSRVVYNYRYSRPVGPINVTRSGRRYRARHDATYTQNSKAYGVAATLDGLVVGGTYRISGRIALGPDFMGAGGDLPNIQAIGVAGIGWAKTVNLPKPNSTTGLGEWVDVSYDFVATATSHQVRIACAETVTRSGSGTAEDLWIDRFDLTTLKADPYTLRGNALEGSLVNHLDLLADSVGGLWTMNTDDIVDVRRFVRPTVVAVFSDVAEPSYTALASSYSTQDVINDLEVSHLGRDAAGAAADETAAYENTASKTRWMPRKASVTWNLATAAQRDARAAEVLAERADADWLPTSLTYLYDDLDSQIDVHDAVTITRRGREFTCLVTDVAHDVRPKRHTVTLTLRRIA